MSPRSPYLRRSSGWVDPVLLGSPPSPPVVPGDQPAVQDAVLVGEHSGHLIGRFTVQEDSPCPSRSGPRLRPRKLQGATSTVGV